MELMTTRAGRCVASYSSHSPKRIQGISLRLSNFRQRDVHSCGFIAALTVVEYFRPGIDPKDVLKAVRPSINWGVGRRQLRQGFAELGISVRYRKDLTVSELRKCVKSGIPVVVSLWPREWLNDHWTVVYGFAGDRIYFANHRSMTIQAFKREWSDMDQRSQGGSGEGLVCRLARSAPPF